jgi:MOB kinase activator 1
LKQLPPNEDLNEWLAVNTVDFFNQVNLLYGSIIEFCTPQTCEVMSAGPKYEYLWADGDSVRSPLLLTASPPFFFNVLNHLDDFIS